MLNRIIIMGRLGRDPELRRTQNGTPVASFTLAVDRDFKDKASGERVTDWIDVVAWRTTAEFVSRYFTKGRMAVVEGRLQARNWTDKQGNKRVSHEVVADTVYFGDSKRDGDAPSYGGSYNGGANSYGGGSYSAPGGYDAPAPGGAPSEFAEIDDVDGELPF
jgi:single-strand DNA-binding protein